SNTYKNQIFLTSCRSELLSKVLLSYRFCGLNETMRRTVRRSNSRKISHYICSSQQWLHSDTQRHTHTHTPTHTYLWGQWWRRSLFKCVAAGRDRECYSTAWRVGVGHLTKPK